MNNKILLLEDITSVPIIGLYNDDTLSLSKKIANSINETINNINLNHFLGFNFKAINELRGCKSSYNFKDRILEIHYNKYTTFVVPSLYSEYHHICKYFNIKENKNFLFESKVEESFKSLSLFENITMKGDAGGIFSKAIKTGKKTAARYFKHEIKIENSNSILSMAESINRDIERILGVSQGKTFIQNKITDFLVNADTVNVQELYDNIFNANIQSKYVKEYKRNFESFFNDRRVSGELFGKSTEKEVSEMIAKSYNVSVDELKKSNALQTKSIIEKAKRILSIVTNSLEGAIHSVFSLLFGTLSFSTFIDGIGATVSKIISFSLSKIFDFLRWAFSIEYTADVQAKPDGNFFDSFSSAYENAKIMASNAKESVTQGLYDTWNFILKHVLSMVDTSQKVILNSLGEVTSKIESLPYINYAKYAVATILFYFFVKNLISLFKNIISIFLGHKIEDEALYSRLSPEKIINNFGFDKIIVTEAITYILSAHIDKALKEGVFNVEEKARLKLMYTKLKSVYKEKCDEGIRFFVKEVK